MNELSRLARVRDEDLAGRASGAGARTLLAAVTAGEPPVQEHRVRHPRRTRRLVVGALATAALAAAVVVGPGFLREGSSTSYANSAMKVELRGDYWIATVRDPFADHRLYAEAFRAVGLDISLELVPVAPGRVGQVVKMSGGTGPSLGLGGGLEPEGCTVGEGDCALTVEVGRDFTGKGVLYLGRMAKPGERYQSHGPATAKGEILAGVRVDERTVGEVRAEVDKRGLKTVYQIIKPSPDGNGFGVDPDAQDQPVGDDWIVWEAESDQEGVVRLLVSEKRVPKNPVYDGPKPADLTSE